MKYSRYNVYKRLSKANERYGMGISLRPVIYMAVLSILSTLAAMISPYLYSLLLDEVMVNGDLGPLPYILLAMICVYAAGAGLSALTVHTDAHFSNKVGLAVKTKLFDQLTGKEIAQVWDMEVGYYKKMLDEDCMEAAGFYTEQIGGFICSFLTAAVYLFLMLFIHPQLTAVSVLFIPVAALFGRYTGRKLNRFQNELWRKCSENTTFLTDTIQKWREIKAQNLELKLTREYERRLLPEKELNIQQIKYLGLNRLFYEFKNNFIQNLLLYFLGGLFIILGQISIGSLLMFMNYLNRFSSNIDNIMNARTDFEGKKAVFERLLEELETEIQMKDVLTENQLTVSFHNVDFSYGPDLPRIFQKFSYSFEAGRKYLIAGRSGEGKSTLIKLLLCMYAPSDGEIKVNGKNLKNVSQPSYLRRIGAVMQESHFFNLSIRDNLLLVSPEASEEEMMGACELAGLAGFIESAQKGLDTVIGERGIKLSGGQRQRLAIARLILYHPEIAVLDEAASSLDETTKQYVTRNLIRLFNGKTLIIVSHNPDVWTAFDEKLIL